MKCSPESCLWSLLPLWPCSLDNFPCVIHFNSVQDGMPIYALGKVHMCFILSPRSLSPGWLPLAIHKAGLIDSESQWRNTHTHGQAYLGSVSIKQLLLSAVVFKEPACPPFHSQLSWLTTRYRRVNLFTMSVLQREREEGAVKKKKEKKGNFTAADPQKGAGKKLPWWGQVKNAKAASRVFWWKQNVKTSRKVGRAGLLSALASCQSSGVVVLAAACLPGKVFLSVCPWTFSNSGLA